MRARATDICGSSTARVVTSFQLARPSATITYGIATFQSTPPIDPSATGSSLPVVTGRHSKYWPFVRSFDIRIDVVLGNAVEIAQQQFTTIAAMADRIDLGKELVLFTDHGCVFRNEQFCDRGLDLPDGAGPDVVRLSSNIYANVGVKLLLVLIVRLFH
jgi:hypothetical protein